LSEGKDSKLTADYARALLATQDFAQATSVIEQYGRGIFINSELTDLLKQAFLGLHKSEEGWDKYLADLQASALKVMREDLAKKMIK